MMWFYFEYILLLFAPGIDEKNETAASLQGATLKGGGNEFQQQQP